MEQQSRGFILRAAFPKPVFVGTALAHCAHSGVGFVPLTLENLGIMGVCGSEPQSELG